MKNLPKHMLQGDATRCPFLRWWRSVTGTVEDRRELAARAEVEALAAQLRLQLAKRIAYAWRGVEGKTAADGFTAGMGIGRAIGSGVGAVVGSAGGAGVGQIVEATGGVLVGLVLAILPLEKENLRARFDDEVASWSPIERYLGAALVRELAAAARRKESATPLGDSWRTDGGGFKTVWGPLFTVAGHYHLEALYRGEWPVFAPSVTDEATLYALAAAVATEDDDARLSDVGSWMSTGRARVGSWYASAYELAGRPTAGELRSMARARGLSGIDRAPLGEWARPLLEDALRKRGER